MKNKSNEKNANEPLTMAYFRNARCSNPHCTVNHAEGGLWLHQNCHTKEGLQLTLKDGVLHESCAVCFRPVVSIAVSTETRLLRANDGFLRNYCHRMAPLWVFYDKGALHIHCSRCENEIDKLTVAEEESATHERRATTPA